MYKSCDRKWSGSEFQADGPALANKHQP